MSKNFDITRDIAANIVGVSARRIKSMTFEDSNPKLHAKKIEGRWMWQSSECKALRKERNADETTNALAKEWDALHRKYDGMLKLSSIGHARSGDHSIKASKSKAKGKQAKQGKGKSKASKPTQAKGKAKGQAKGKQAKGKKK